MRAMPASTPMSSSMPAAASISTARSPRRGTTWPSLASRRSSRAIWPEPVSSGPPRYATNPILRKQDRASCCGLAILVAEAVHQRLVLAAIDLDHGAVDHLHQRRRQHHHQIGDLVDFGEAAHGYGSRRQRVGL